MLESGRHRRCATSAQPLDRPARIDGTTARWARDRDLGRHHPSMMWLKGCPRCQGDLFEELAVAAELYGTRFVNCLQCGYSLTAEQERQLPRARDEAVASAAMRRSGASAVSGG
jgi:hypothetical protein